MGITEFEWNGLCSDWLYRAAHQQPSASALVLQDASFDYATLQSLTAQLCQLLRAQGLKPGATIVVESRSATLLAFLLHAALFADFVLFPLDPRLPDEQRKRLLELVRADLILNEDDIVRLNHVIEVMTAANLLAPAGQAEHVCAVKSPPSPDRLRLLLATSGSCGLPKLVNLSERNLQASVQAANERLKLSHTSVWLDCLPLVHIGGLSILLRCACAGASVVLHEGFDATVVMDDLHNHQVSHISLVPAMLAQLLDLAKLEAGRGEWQISDIDPKEVIEESVAATGSLLSESHMELQIRVPDALRRVRADRDRFIQVMVNLLSNAVKFCDGAEPKVIIDVEETLEGLLVSVEDNGPGIPRGAEQRIFEKFEQVDARATSKPVSTGLGLPICRQIVEYFGGRIWVERTRGAGARFVFTVPFAAGMS